MCLNKYSLHVFMSFVFLKVFTMYTMQTNICDLWLSRSRMRLLQNFFFFFKCSRVSSSLIWDSCYVWNKLDSLTWKYLHEIYVRGKTEIKNSKGFDKKFVDFKQNYSILLEFIISILLMQKYNWVSQVTSVFIKKILLDN